MILIVAPQFVEEAREFFKEFRLQVVSQVIGSLEASLAQAQRNLPGFKRK